MSVPPTETSLTWTGGTLFETVSPGGDVLQLDMPLAKGGSGHGFSPMTLLLHSLAACMAVTVVQILEKQRLTLSTTMLLSALPLPLVYLIPETRPTHAT